MKIEGPWYVTRKAALDYARLLLEGDPERNVEVAREALVRCARSARKVRQEEGVEIWRATPEYHRIGLVVGPPPEGVVGALPALIGVLAQYRGWTLRQERKGEPRR